MNYPLLTLEIRFEQDIVLARQRARQIADLLGFDKREQTRIATAVSEVARNAYQYAGGGKVEFLITGQFPQSFLTRISDNGPGIADVEAVLDGRAKREGSMGLGLVGARRLIDDVDIDSAIARGTVVSLSKPFPKCLPPLDNQQLLLVVEELARRTPQEPLAEIQEQNRELLQTLAELRQRQEELALLNQELEDTNRGVIALYAELSDKAESLKSASELKSRFLSYMSHEFRTPLNAIKSLSEMLLARLDGELTAEQEKQVNFIHKSAESLTELTNDLLDLAKVEAGKLDIRIAPVEVSELFSALRGMMRPLLIHNNDIELIFEEPSDEIGTLATDEGKVSQILRNLISNAIKYSDRGTIRVMAKRGPNETVVFSVADTGFGIASEDRSRIFEEFVRLDRTFKKKIQGTGLGLPLCKKLVELLGGSIDLYSELGVGSTFLVTLPIVYSDSKDEGEESKADEPLALSSQPMKILIVDDDEVDRYATKSLLAGIEHTAIEAVDGYEGLERAQTEQPQIVLLDLMMPGLTGFEVLERLKANPTTANIPVIINTSKSLEKSEYERLATSAVAILSKQNESRSFAIARLKEAFVKAGLYQSG